MINAAVLYWRDGRVVECGGLENRCSAIRGTGGSNPPLSATSNYFPTDVRRSGFFIYAGTSQAQHEREQA